MYTTAAAAADRRGNLWYRLLWVGYVVICLQCVKEPHRYDIIIVSNLKMNSDQDHSVEVRNRLAKFVGTVCCWYYDVYLNPILLYYDTDVYLVQCHSRCQATAHYLTEQRDYFRFRPFITFYKNDNLPNLLKK